MECSCILNIMRDEERFRECPSTSLRTLTLAISTKCWYLITFYEEIPGQLLIASVERTTCIPASAKRSKAASACSV